MLALRSSSAAAATVAAADRVTGGARTRPPVFPEPSPSRPPTGPPPAPERRRRFFPSRRRAGRRPRAVATDAPRGTPCQGAMCALRISGTAAATVAAADQVTASARMSPLVFPCRRRAGRRPRTVATVAPRGTSVQSAMRALRRSSAAAATVAAAGRVTASARTLPPVFQSRRRAGRRPRTVATAAPRGTPSQGAMHALRGSMSAAATVAAPALATVSARIPPPVVRRSRRDGPARYFGRAPAHRGTPSQVRRSAPSTAFSILPAPSHRRAVHRIRAPGQVSHITTGPRASSVFHNQHRCGKRRAADALAM